MTDALVEDRPDIRAAAEAGARASRIQAGQSAPIGAANREAALSLLALLRRRRPVPAFRDAPVERGKLDAVLEAGHSLPLPGPVAYFFFQAEDGIRDHCVTGVQTCALPI